MTIISNDQRLQFGHVVVNPARIKFAGQASISADSRKRNKSSWVHKIEKMIIKDVVIIGGSYAGLSAAMALGRSMREAIIIDSGNPCNKHSRNAHNFLGHDGISPEELSQTSKEEVLCYPTISVVYDQVANIETKGDTFRVMTLNGKTFESRKLIFATGIADEMPDIAGFAECWGISLLHCPYCHGYEFQGRKTGIIASGNTAFEFAELLSRWTKNLYLLTNGETRLEDEQLQLLADKNIMVVDNQISHIEHNQGLIRFVCFTDQSGLELEAAYARPFMKQQCSLPEEMGCAFHGMHIQVDQYQQTSVPGIFAAGDNCSPLRSLANAVAAGSVAGAYINKELSQQEFFMGVGYPQPR